MLNFLQPHRWLVLQYRPGSGGKFVSACLQTIQCIAHWDPMVEHGEISFIDWVNQQWTHKTADKWIAYEPLHVWETTFFSRTYARGNDLTLSEYNRLMNDQASSYLKEILMGEKLILDYMCRPSMPIWWEQANILKLDAPSDCEIYKNFLLNKIYPYDSITKKGVVMLDKPLDDNKYQNARLYNNQFEFGPFESADEWYHYIRFNDFKLNFPIENPDMFTKDLLDYSKVELFISQVASQFNSVFNKDDLKYLHEYWINTQ